MQIVDIVMKLVAIGVAHRGQFLHADLDHPRQIFDPLLRRRDDFRLRAQG